MILFKYSVSRNCFSIILVSDDGETHEGYFARDFIDFEQAKCDFEEHVNLSKKEEIAILIFFVFFALVVGFLVAVVVLNWRLAKNGHHLREMLRKRGNLNNEGFSNDASVNNNTGIENPRLSKIKDEVIEVAPPVTQETAAKTPPEGQTDGAAAKGDMEMENIPIE